MGIPGKDYMAQNGTSVALVLPSLHQLSPPPVYTSSPPPQSTPVLLLYSLHQLSPHTHLHQFSSIVYTGSLDEVTLSVAPDPGCSLSLPHLPCIFLFHQLFPFCFLVGWIMFVLDQHPLAFCISHCLKSWTLDKFNCPLSPRYLASQECWRKSCKQ